MFTDIQADLKLHSDRWAWGRIRWNRAADPTGSFGVGSKWWKGSTDIQGVELLPESGAQLTGKLNTVQHTIDGVRSTEYRPMQGACTEYGGKIWGSFPLLIANRMGKTCTKITYGNGNCLMWKLPVPEFFKGRCSTLIVQVPDFQQLRFIHRLSFSYRQCEIYHIYEVHTEYLLPMYRN